MTDGKTVAMNGDGPGGPIPRPAKRGQRDTIVTPFPAATPMSLISFADAKTALLARAPALPAAETVDLAAAFARTLTTDLISPLSVPPFANAAMDGYALCAADVPRAGTRLPLSQRIAAGDAAGIHLAGSAARIFTGAPLPPGADTVVMQEHCVAEDAAVIINLQPASGEHVRLAGSDIQAGQVILRAGSHLSAAALGLAASVGYAEVAVYRRLRVAILFTGAELTPPGQPLGPGKIYNSNRYVMRGFLAELGVDIVDLGVIADDLAATRAALRSAAAQADVVLTSGGMSEGDEDHVIGAVRAEGQIDVWKIAAKPGKPLAFGSLRNAGNGAVFIGLPGNPVAVWCGLLTLVAPFLRRCQGARVIEPAAQQLRADFSYKVKGNRLEFVRVRRNDEGGLDVYPTQDSSVIASAVWADGLAALPAGSVVQPGDLVSYLAGPRL